MILLFRLFFLGIFLLPCSSLCPSGTLFAVSTDPSSKSGSALSRAVTKEGTSNLCSTEGRGFVALDVVKNLVRSSTMLLCSSTNASNKFVRQSSPQIVYYTYKSNTDV